MINKLTFNERSLLFAKLSSIAYQDQDNAIKNARKLGFTTVEFYENKSAQAYRFQNKNDMVIACRGTQPTQWLDIRADLRAYPVKSETVSRVHKGFKNQADRLWPMIISDITRTQNKNKNLWFCGHSLGAAMATIMASRCHKDQWTDQVQELYTYGSPRVGWKDYVRSLEVTHHRWVNNNDIVTTVPLRTMGYKHHGNRCYINSQGKVVDYKLWNRIKDKVKGFFAGILKGKIDSFSDHSIDLYIKYLEETNAKKKA